MMQGKTRQSEMSLKTQARSLSVIDKPPKIHWLFCGLILAHVLFFCLAPVIIPSDQLVQGKRKSNSRRVRCIPRQDS